MRQTVRTDKASCTGCGACVSICPKGAITMRPDEEGFLYPVVDEKRCVSCDLCEKRCPVGKSTVENHPDTFGAQHKDSAIRRASSSGGIFTALALQEQARGGVVFGAVFDEKLHVEHVGALDETELSRMRGSKYVQSDTAEAIEHAASLLERGIPVLFSGTPCQIAGLKARLNGKYDSLLLTVDFVCHGVPSPGVFASYLKELEQKHGSPVTGYTFRDKRNGWTDFCAVATFADGSESVGNQVTESFLYGFLQNLYLRPSCLQCDTLRENHHQADLTLADMWLADEICADRNDDTGLSMVFANTEKGVQALQNCVSDAEIFPITLTDKMRKYNSGLTRPAKSHPKRDAFFARYRKHGFNGTYVFKALAGPSWMERGVRRVAHLPIGLVRRIRACFKSSKTNG